MKELFKIILLTITLSGNAATFYIDTSGNDKTGDGSKMKPWATLSFACLKVKNEGDFIHIKTGTYIETKACKLYPGVSLEGEGIKTVIKSHYNGKSTDNYDALIQLISESVTNGDQQLRYLKIDGDNLKGDKAIAVFNRENVHIHDCYIVDFKIQGIKFGGGLQSGNSVFNNFIINCAGVTNDQHACLSINDNIGMQVYNNTISQPSRSDGKNGTCVESWKGLKDFKFFNNNVIAVPYTEDNWSFAFEFWLTEGGIEIFNNKISGCIDFGKDVYKGEYQYGLDFHHNIVGYDTLKRSYTDGLQLEQTIESVIIRNNIFKNLERPIYFCQYNYPDDYVIDIFIYNNLIINVGREKAKKGTGIYFESGPISPIFVTNINIWNNTIIGNSSFKPQNGIFLPTSNKVSNINIKNNIIIGFSNAPLMASLQAKKGLLTNVSIENNLFFDNGNRNSPKYDRITPRLITCLKNKKGKDPEFISENDFHLGENSPAIRGGTIVGIENDHDNKPFSNPPSIGAYEYYLD